PGLVDSSSTGGRSTVGPRPSLALVGRGGVDGGPRGGGVEPAEDHPAGAGLQDARDGQPDRLAEVVGALLGDDHRAVVEVADTLPRLLAALDQLDREALAGQDDRL